MTQCMDPPGTTREEYLGVQLFKFSNTIAESNNFSRADEGEVLGVEEEDDILAQRVADGSEEQEEENTSVIFKIDGSELAIDNGGGLEVGGNASDEGLGTFILLVGEKSQEEEKHTVI